MHRGAEYQVRGASSDEDLRQILTLQSANLPETLDSDERDSQGFLSLRHDLGLLREMNTPHPHVVVTHGDPTEVVAYALFMLNTFRGRLPLIDPMFERLDRLTWRARPLASYRTYIMGQVCVAKAHRGRGLVERLYAGHRARMSGCFDLVITEINRANPRSVRAHEKAGFEVLDEYSAQSGERWLVVALDFRTAPGP